MAELNLPQLEKKPLMTFCIALSVLPNNIGEAQLTKEQKQVLAEAEIAAKQIIHILDWQAELSRGMREAAEEFLSNVASAEDESHVH